MASSQLISKISLSITLRVARGTAAVVPMICVVSPSSLLVDHDLL